MEEPFGVGEGGGVDWLTKDCLSMESLKSWQMGDSENLLLKQTTCFVVPR